MTDQQQTISSFLLKQTQQDIRSNYRLSQSLSPDSAAKDFTVSKSLGVNPDLVSRQREASYAQAEINSFLSNMDKSPALTEFVRNRHNLAMSKDDIANLVRVSSMGELERAGYNIAEGSKAVARNMFSSVRGLFDFLSVQNELAYKNMPDELKEKLLKEKEARRIRFEKRGWTLPTGDVSKEVKAVADWASEMQNKKIFESDELPRRKGMAGYWDDIVQMAPQVAAQMGVTLTAGPYASVGFMGSQIAGSKYESLINQGVDANVAFEAAVADALLQAPLEQIGLSKALKVWKPTGAFSSSVKEIFKATGTEFVTELLQKYPEAATEIWAKAQADGKSAQDQVTIFFKNIGDITAQGVYEGLVAAPFGGVTSTTGAIFNNYMGKKSLSNKAEEFRNKQIEANDKINSTKLKGRSVEKMEEFLDLSGYDREAFLTAEGVEVLFQKNPEALAKLGITEDMIPNLSITGVNTALKLSALHSQLTPEEFKTVVEYIAPDKNTPSMFEIKEAREVFAASMEAQIQEAELNKEAQTQFDNELESVYEDIKARREATGRVLKTAQSDAEYWKAFVGTYSDRYGFSPLEVYGAFVPTVKAKTFEGSVEQRKIKELESLGAALKQVEEKSLALQTVEEFNKENPEFQLKYDGEMDLSVLNRPNLHQFTAYGGGIKGATFTTTSPSIDALKTRVSEMVEAWAPKKGELAQNIAGAFDRESNVISLFESASASTFLHESGHAFFEFMSRSAQVQEAPQNLKNDWEVIAKQVGNDGKSALTEEQHEKLAKALEAYFMQGKAPSLKLREVFQRFSVWLKNLYDSVKKLSPDLNPELEKMFARMFATDKDIEEAQVYYDSQKPFFKALEGEDRAEYDRLRKQAELDSKSKRLKKYIDVYLRAIGGEKQLYKEAATIINEFPVYKSMDTAVVGGGFPTYLMDQMIGEESRKELSKKRVGLISKKGTVDPDFIARENGYSDTNLMFSDMLKAESKKDMREKIVIRKLEKIQKDMLSHVENDFPAEEDYHSDSRMKVITAELQFLQREKNFKAGREKARVTRIKTKAVKDVAKSSLESKSVREAEAYNKYSRAEAKAAKLARAAYEKGDLETAEKYKRQELLNHALVIEAVRIRDEIQKGSDRVKKLLKSKVMNQDQIDLVNDVAVRFGFKSRPPRTTHEEAVKYYEAWLGETDSSGKPRKQIDFNAWEKNQIEKGYGTALSWLVKDRGSKTFYKDLKLESFRAIIDSVNQIATIDLNDRKIMIEGKRVDLKKAVQDLKSSLAENYTPKQKRYFEKNKKNFLNTIDASLVKMEFLFRVMDGGKIGPWHQTIFQKVAEAEEKENIRIIEANKNIKEIFDKHYTKAEQRDLFSSKWKMIPEIGEAPTKAQMLRVFLDFGNIDNYEKRRDGHGWTDQQMAAIKDSLDKKDYDFCQDIWDYISSFKDESFSLEKRMTGREPTAVMPNPIETRFGTYAGGYFPISFDPDGMNITQSRKQVEEALLYGTPNYAHAMTKKGHLKERQATAGGQVLSKELTDITRHVSGVIHDVTHREAVVDISKIFNDKEMETALREYLGPEVVKQFMPWLKDIANTAPTTSLGERIAKGVRISMTVAKLGKFSVMLQQIAGFTQSVQILGKQSWRIPKAFSKMVASPLQTYDSVTAKSDFMKTRVTNYNREAHDAFKGLNIYKKTSQAIGDFAMKGIGYLQYMVDIPTWTSAYDAHLSEGFTEKQAVAYANSVVRMSQGGGGVKDLARVQRGNEYFKLATMFYSFMNLAYNLFTKSGRGKNFNFKELSSAIFFVGLLGPMAAELLSGRPPEDDEEFTAWLAKLEMGFYSGMFPIFRDIAGSVTTGFGYRLSPVEQPVESVVKGVRRAVREEDITELAKPAFEIGGMVFRLPTDQMLRSSEAFWHWISGDPDFEAQQLIYGGKYKE